MAPVQTATSVLPRWESVSLVAVNYADVAGWVGELSERVGPFRCRKAAMLLRAVLDSAVRDQRLPRNPSVGVRLPRLPEQEKRFLTLAELVGLAGAAGRDRLMVLVMGVCGLRFGEVVALRVGCVDAIRGRLIVRASVSEVGGHVVWSTPKSHQSRQVPVPASLMVQLSVAIRGRAADELVFTSKEGATIRAGNWRRRVWDRAVAASGLESLTPHDLRHTAASLAISSGASVKHIQRMLGHKDASMTLNVYASLFEDDLDLVGQRIDGLLAPLAASVRPVEGLSAASAKTRRTETGVD